VIVLHGGSGLGEHAVERTRMLAEAGYAAFAPDLFGRRIACLEEAEAETSGFLQDDAGLQRACNAARESLAGHPQVDASRIAVIGFCFGGQVALEYARTGADIKATVAFHARLASHHLQRARTIRGQVLVCLGTSDRFVSGEEREAFLAEMAAGEVDCRMLLFPGVCHSFTDRRAAASGVPGLRYDARADRASWRAMLSMLDDTFIAEPGC
jgi:dienelactone hydrolase